MKKKKLPIINLPESYGIKDLKPNSPETKEILERFTNALIQALRNDPYRWDNLVDGEVSKEYLNSLRADPYLAQNLKVKEIEEVEEKESLIYNSATAQKNVQTIQSIEGLKEMARNHWKKYLPILYKQLSQNGELENVLTEAAETTHLEVQQTKVYLMKMHPGIGEEMALNSAWEIHKEELILQEAEE